MIKEEFNARVSKITLDKLKHDWLNKIPLTIPQKRALCVRGVEVFTDAISEMDASGKY